MGALKMSFALSTFPYEPNGMAAFRMVPASFFRVSFGAISPSWSQYEGGCENPAVENRSRFQYRTSGSAANGRPRTPVSARYGLAACMNVFSNCDCEIALDRKS